MTHPRTVAVIVSYWPNRRDNVRQIVNALAAGSVAPDDIYVLNNNPGELGLLDVDHDDVHVIVSSANTMTRGKYVAALLDPAPRYLLIDDDVLPGRESLGHLQNWCDVLQTPDGRFVTGFWGARLTPDGSFMRGQIIQPNYLSQPLKVDGFHGRFVYTTHPALVRMLQSETRVRLDGRWPHQGCDILMGLANPDASWAVPLVRDAWWTELPDGGQALQHDPTYFAERDRFVLDVLERREALL